MNYDVFFDYIPKGFNNDVGYIRSNYLKKLHSLEKLNTIKVISGLRRVGKSYILKQFINNKLQQGFAISNIFYLHLDNYKIDDNLNIGFLGEIFNHFLENYFDPTKNNGEFFLFFDEIQNIPNRQKFIRTINEQYGEKAKIYITGSNSNLLSGELATLLTGRFSNINIYPFSFKEFLDIKKITLSKIDTQKYDYFEEYLTYGGLPEVIKTKNIDTKKNYISDLVDSILFKDIIQRWNIRKTSFLSNLTKFIYKTTCSEFSVTSILKYLQQSIKSLDYNTVDKYLGYLQNSFLINELHSISFKAKETLRGNSKYYSYDIGVRSIFSNNYDIEKSLENLVYLELKRKGYEINCLKISSFEVDFVADKYGKKTYFQVSYTIKDKKTYDREIRSLLEINDNYSKIILTVDEGQKEDRGIIIKNIIERCLED